MRKIVIVGLGLIGGSLAAALRGFEDFIVVGANRSRKAIEYAQEHDMADETTDDIRSAVRDGDVVICCLPPLATLDFFKIYQNDFKSGSLVTDVCGVKQAVMNASSCLPDSVDFIGGHPMAGKEKGGIKNADKNLFFGSHYIITPRDTSRAENINLMNRLAKYIGCRDITNTTAENHDAIIAYTSQVMHVLAVAICDNPTMFDCLGFEGGSFRDCTRVAALDPQLWTELFSLNRKSLVAVIEQLEDNLQSYKDVILNGNMDLLCDKLTYSSERKKKMNFEHTRGDDPKI